MKPKIHPEYKDTAIVCACGEVIQTRSTRQNIHIEICSKCHPFFTGKQKLIDSAGRVDKFMKRYEKKQKPKAKKEKIVEQDSPAKEEKEKQEKE
ncbi:MAG: 50S ribosomal protein L31 [Candidatus Omnitrophica bacterium]|nr:50S ribosomal protein L31 [Candidatus Omnitrophota bacterium]